MKTFISTARWEKRGTVTIDAESLESAKEKLSTLEDTYFDDSGSEIINWELVSNLKEYK